MIRKDSGYVDEQHTESGNNDQRSGSDHLLGGWAVVFLLFFVIVLIVVLFGLPDIPGYKSGPVPSGYP
jgi:hypothetical protein